MRLSEHPIHPPETSEWFTLAPEVKTVEHARIVARTLALLAIARIEGSTAEVLPGESRAANGVGFFPKPMPPPPGEPESQDDEDTQP